MLKNPNFEDNSNDTEVKELDTYYIKDNKLYCYGYNTENIVFDKDKLLDTCIFNINKSDKIKNPFNKRLFIIKTIVNSIMILFGLLFLFKFYQMEIGLFIIAFDIFINISLLSMDRKILHKCSEYYVLHKNEIKNYDRIVNIVEEKKDSE